MESLFKLHSLGLLHNDAEKRNIVYDAEDKVFKFIDLARSEWHYCQGINFDCGEMYFFGGRLFRERRELLAQFQEKVINQYGLVFCNLKESVGQEKQDQIYQESIVKNLKERADHYDKMTNDLYT